MSEPTPKTRAELEAEVAAFKLAAEDRARLLHALRNSWAIMSANWEYLRGNPGSADSADLAADIDEVLRRGRAQLEALTKLG